MGKSVNSAFHVDLAVSENGVTPKISRNFAISAASPSGPAHGLLPARYVCSYDLDDGSKAKLRPILPEDEGGAPGAVLSMEVSISHGGNHPKMVGL